MSGKVTACCVSVSNTVWKLSAVNVLSYHIDIYELEPKNVKHTSQHILTAIESISYFKYHINIVTHNVLSCISYDMSIILKSYDVIYTFHTCILEQN